MKVAGQKFLRKSSHRYYGGPVKIIKEEMRGNNRYVLVEREGKTGMGKKQILVRPGLLHDTP